MPLVFRKTPTHRLIAPGLEAQHLHDDTRGRALDPLYASGVTELYRLIATAAAERLGFTPTLAPLDRTSVHVDGHYNSAAEPDAPVLPMTQGYSRDPRPDLNQVLRDLIVEHHAGIPVLMKPLSGHTSDASDFGQVVPQHIEPLQTAPGFASLVADGALYTTENLQKLAHTSLNWITRVPATLNAVQEALATADPKALVPLREGSRYHRLASSYGGMAPRWVLLHSAHRRPQAQRTVEQDLLTQSPAEGKAFKQLGRTMFACTAAAQQALATCAQGLPATSLHAVTRRPQPREAQRGRPGNAMPPDEPRYDIEGALASS
jgi:transposase